MLCKFSSFTPEPRQSADTTLSTYIADWLQYVHNQVLDGVILSDRYFHQQFLHNMHPQLRGRIGQYLLQAVMTVPLNQALPPSFAPDRFLSHVTQHVRYLGQHQLLHKSPRQLSSPSTPATSSSAVRFLHRDHPSDPAPSSQLESLLVATMQNPGPCLLCRSSDHLFAQCPSLAALRDEPTLLRILQRALQRISTGHAPSSTTRSTQSTNNRSSPSTRPQLRQLTASVDPSAHPNSQPTVSSELLQLPAISAGEGSSPDVELIPMSDSGEGMIPSNPTSPDFC